MSAADDYRRLLRATARLAGDPIAPGANAALIREFLASATASLEDATLLDGSPGVVATFDLTKRAPGMPGELELAFTRALERAGIANLDEQLTIWNGITSLRDDAVSDDPAILAEEARLN